MWQHHGIGERWKAYSNDLAHLLLFIIVNPRGTGAFSRDFTTNLAQQCRALKLKAPLFLGPDGAGDTDDWCISVNIHEGNGSNGSR